MGFKPAASTVTGPAVKRAKAYLVSSILFATAAVIWSIVTYMLCRYCRAAMCSHSVRGLSCTSFGTGAVTAIRTTNSVPFTGQPPEAGGCPGLHLSAERGRADRVSALFRSRSRPGFSHVQRGLGKNLVLNPNLYPVI